MSLKKTQQKENAQRVKSENQAWLQMMPIDDIKPHPSNPRTIKDEEFQRLVESIRDFPEMLHIRPIVIGTGGFIIGGKQRHAAAKEAGCRYIATVDASYLSEEKQREFMLRDNKSSGDWDVMKLLAEFELSLINAVGINIPSVDDVIGSMPEEETGITVTVKYSAPNLDAANAFAEEMTLRGLEVKVKK